MSTLSGKLLNILELAKVLSTGKWTVSHFIEENILNDAPIDSIVIASNLDLYVVSGETNIYISDCVILVRDESPWLIEVCEGDGKGQRLRSSFFNLGLKNEKRVRSPFEQDKARRNKRFKEHLERQKAKRKNSKKERQKYR